MTKRHFTSMTGYRNLHSTTLSTAPQAHLFAPPPIGHKDALVVRGLFLTILCLCGVAA